jgi:crotonobetainyl-CoA:carnitine CoA-transferase CaiB-like acyl-CoA transferase
MELDENSVALGGFRVLDLTQSLGQYTTRLLADLGAIVVKIEPPDGGSARFAWPNMGDIADGEHSLAFLHFNLGKQSVVLDLTTSEGRESFLGLVRTSDVVVEDAAPGYMRGLALAYEDLRDVNPRIVYTSITPYGQSGPRSNQQGGDLTVQALSGWMSTDGDDEFPPSACPADPTTHMSGMHAAFGTLLALWARRQTGVGQAVDVSSYEVMVASLSALPIARYSLAAEVTMRTGARANIAAVNYYKCRDGYVAMNIHFDHLWRRLVEWINHPVLNEPYWLTREARQENVDLCEEIIHSFAAGLTVGEFLEGARNRGLPVAQVNTFKQAVQDPQLEARGWLQETSHPLLGVVSVPGFPWSFSRTQPRARGSAPLLGEHSTEILRAPLGSGASPPEGTHGKSASDVVQPAPPLEGIRVIDFTRAFAGPFASRLLADYGAEVIKVESNLFDTQRGGRAGTFTELNRNKLSITVDLHHREGQELIKRLVAVSDVVIDNFRAGTLDRFDLGYESLSQINPGIVLVSMPAYGSTGPAADYAAHGTQLIAGAGVAYLWGDPESPIEARPKSTYPDFVAGAQAALAVLAGLHARETAGSGQAIEMPQYEALLATLGVGLLDYLVNERVWAPMGSRRPDAAPHNAYACLGLDAYCVIACTNDDQWRSLCDVMGRRDVEQDSRFSSVEDRLHHVDELDRLIEEWTKGLTPRQVERRLQLAGVPAAAFQTGEDVYFDRHLRDSGFVTEVDDPEVGHTEISGLTIHLSQTPGLASMQGRPQLGGANTYVFQELLGITPVELRRLKAEKAIA